VILQLWEGTLKKIINQKKKRNRSLIKYILPNSQNKLTMRCKKCGFINMRPQEYQCWKKWNLCSICAVEEHPDKYTINQQGSILSKRYDWAKSQIPHRVKEREGDLVGI